MNKSTQKNKAVFLLNTEYGLLISYLYYKVHLEPNGITPLFVFLPTSENRFKNISFDDLPGKFCIYKNELNSWKIFPNNEFEKFEEISEVSHVIVNNPIFFVSSIIVNRIRRENNNCKFLLLADSVSIDRKMPLKHLLLFKLKLYVRKFFNFYSYLPNQLIHYGNAENYYDSLIAHRNLFKTPFVNSNGLLKELLSHKKELFNIFSLNIDGFNKAETVFFTQPILKYNFDAETKSNYIKVIELLCNLSIKNKKQLLFKVHPAESCTDYEKYISKYVSIDANSNVPAEILVNSLTNKKFVSVSSSASCFDVNNNNKHYWLDTIVTGKKVIIDKTYVYIINVSELSKIEEILFNS